MASTDRRESGARASERASWSLRGRSQHGPPQNVNLHQRPPVPQTSSESWPTSISMTLAVVPHHDLERTEPESDKDGLPTVVSLPNKVDTPLPSVHLFRTQTAMQRRASLPGREYDDSSVSNVSASPISVTSDDNTKGQPPNARLAAPQLSLIGAPGTARPLGRSLAPIDRMLRPDTGRSGTSRSVGPSPSSSRGILAQPFVTASATAGTALAFPLSAVLPAGRRISVRSNSVMLNRSSSKLAHFPSPLLSSSEYMESDKYALTLPVGAAVSPTTPAAGAVAMTANSVPMSAPDRAEPIRGEGMIAAIDQTAFERPETSTELVQSAANVFDASRTTSQEGSTTTAQSRRKIVAMPVGIHRGSIRPTVSFDRLRSAIGSQSLYPSERKAFEEARKSYGQALKGPILLQTCIHYACFIVILTSANHLGWSTKIRFYMIFVYFNIAVLVIQVARICYTLRENSVVPFYVALIPFALICTVAREARQIVMVLWYVSWLVIHLQSGHPRLRRHLVAYSILHLLTYGIVIWFMIWFFRDGCQSFMCGEALGTPIIVQNEIILCVACVTVIVWMVVFEDFMKQSAARLLQREQEVRRLASTNQKLRKELMELERNNTEKDVGDFDAPISKVIAILKEVKSSSAADDTMIMTLDLIIDVLASDRLFTPDLNEKPLDEDVSTWLNNLFQTSQSTGPKAPRSSGSRLDSMAPMALHGSLPASSARTPSTLDVASGATQAESGEPSRISQNVPQDIELAFWDLSSEEHQAACRILETLDNDVFDVFELNRLTKGHALFFVGTAIMRRMNYLEGLRIPEAIFRSWLLRIEAGYNAENPYHNCLHAADVTQAMHHFMGRPKLAAALHHLETFAGAVAAIVHDFRHPGLGNGFLVNTLHPLAIRYNDTAVLENFHCASAFDVMQLPECDILASLSAEDRTYVRELIVSMVLSTDMAKHFEWIGKFKSKISASGFDLEKPYDRKMALNFAIKCADVNNPSKPLELCRQWTDRVLEEFFRQGDLEKQLSIPVSPFMNRTNTDIPKSQLGFISFVVSPLFEAFNEFLEGSIQSFLDNIAANKAYWKVQSDTAASGPVSSSSSSQKSSTPTGRGAAATTSLMAASAKIAERLLPANVVKSQTSGQTATLSNVSDAGSITSSGAVVRNTTSAVPNVMTLPLGRILESRLLDFENAGLRTADWYQFGASR